MAEVDECRVNIDQFDKGDQLECTLTASDGEFETASKTASAKVK